MLRETLLVFVVILLVVMGCGGSDEDESTLVGSWEIVSIDEQPLSTVANLFTFALSFALGFEEEGQIQGIETKIAKNDVVFATDGSYSLRTCFKKKDTTQELMFTFNHWSSRILTQ